MSSTARKVAAGSAWMIATRWALRFIGVGSTLVLARLLTPQDFGLVAMAMLAVGLLEVLTDTGQGLAIIRLKEVCRSHYDTAWTMRALISVATTVLLFILAQPAAAYFREPNVTTLLYILAVRPLLAGLTSIRTVDFRRNLEFNKEFQYRLWPKLAGFAATLLFAIALGDYRALVIGILVQQLGTTLLSYVMAPYVPRFSLARLHELWSFSIWTLFSSTLAFATSKVDEFVIGRLYPAQDMGRYSVAASVGAMPVDELIAPPARALYPGFARLQHATGELQQLYLSTFSILFTLAVASSVGLAAVAEDAALVLLGQQWQDVAPFVKWLALAAGAGGLTTTNYSLWTALGRARSAALSQLLFGLMLGFAMLFGQWWLDLEGIAAARWASTLAVWLGVQWVTCKYIALPGKSVVLLAWRPAISAAVMYLVVRALFSALDIPPAFRLLLMVGAGAASFCIVQSMLWLTTGKGVGVEKLVLDATLPRLRRLCLRAK